VAQGGAIMNPWSYHRMGGLNLGEKRRARTTLREGSAWMVCDIESRF